jgi:hypothetical protein
MRSICEGLTHPCLESLSEARLVGPFYLVCNSEIDYWLSLSANLRVCHWKD